VDAVYAEHFESSVRGAIEPLLAGMGFSLVELSIGRRKGATRVNVVIYRKEGVGVDDCAEVSSLLFPRLETVEGLYDLALEVSSPGIERAIRSPAEYAIFAGRGVRVLAGDETEWRCGIIDRVEDGTLWLRKGREKRGFTLSGVRKARLDHSVEVEEAKNAV
jgi:ribosome maturation factor RimP